MSEFPRRNTHPRTSSSSSDLPHRSPSSSSASIHLPSPSDLDPDIDHDASLPSAQPPPPPPQRPTAAGSTARRSSSYMSTMWTGLIRRFSTEETLSSSSQQPAGTRPSKSSSPPPSPHSSSTNLHQHSLLPATAATRDGINGVFNPTRRTASPFRPPPLEPVSLRGYRHDTTARLLTNTVAEEIRSMVPERLRLMEDWRLVYSLEQDGASLTTLYHKCRMFEAQRVGFVLVVRDQERSTFGAYLSEYPHPAPSYFGNGECFLWRVSTLTSLPPPPSADTTNMTRNTTLSTSTTANSPRTAGLSRPSSSGTATPEAVRFKAFPYSGLNDFYVHCETGFLSVGSGGGHYGLWLDDGLDVGHSSTCDTFGNEPLSDQGEKFGVLGVELWVIGG